MPQTSQTAQRPEDFRELNISSHAQRLKQEAEAAINSASSIVEATSTILGGSERDFQASSEFGDLPDSYRNKGTQDWITHLAIDEDSVPPAHDSNTDTVSNETVKEPHLDPDKTKSYDMDSVEKLLSILGVDPNAKGWNADEALLSLAKIRKAGQDVESKPNMIETFHYLLNRGANVEAVDTDGNSSLHYASRGGHVFLVKLLYERGAGINVTNNKGYTSLHNAASGGHTAVMEFLLSKGARLEQRDKARHHTALHCAVSYDRPQTVEFLLQIGAKIETRSKLSNTPLILAADWGLVTVADVLLKHGAKLEADGGDGRTPLHAAALKGHVAMIEYLLNNGASIESKDEEGSTPLIYAVCRGHRLAINQLLAAGADITARNNYGDTILHALYSNRHDNCEHRYCVFCTHSETPRAILELLCKRGADPLAEDEHGRTVLRWIKDTHGSEEAKACRKSLEKFVN